MRLVFHPVDEVRYALFQIGISKPKTAAGGIILALNKLGPLFLVKRRQEKCGERFQPPARVSISIRSGGNYKARMIGQ